MGSWKHLKGYFFAWHDISSNSASRKRGCIELIKEVQCLRRRRWIGQWLEAGRCKRLRQVAEAWSNRRLACFLAWREQSAAGALRKRHTEKLTREVHHGRRRRWIYQWLEAARWNRLKQVAESWDRCVCGRPRVSVAFKVWAKFVALWM